MVKIKNCTAGKTPDKLHIFLKRHFNSHRGSPRRELLQFSHLAKDLKNSRNFLTRYLKCTIFKNNIEELLNIFNIPMIDDEYDSSYDSDVTVDQKLGEF